MADWIEKHGWFVGAVAYCATELVSLLFGAGILPANLLLRMVRVVGTLYSWWIGAMIEQRLALRSNRRISPLLPEPIAVMRGVIYFLPLVIAQLGVVNRWLMVPSIILFACLVVRAFRLARRAVQEGRSPARG